ncbi:hypothetical protein [Microvirga arabica]|uniref:Uncharacterized protein n=1 Tax=Microvirga arabica TaxID=1128671 RepID=A0ABV6Y392_9HYPH|nr:hypothetical protein [Microvirga arabica]MBM1169696.1 hypothetical protein [Microvirga arabica]
MPREVIDAEGITWTCIQAFAGLGNDPEKMDAARVDGARNKVHIVCTPSGGAKSVRIELAADWETSLPDDDLLQAIRSQLAQESPASQVQS